MKKNISKKITIGFKIKTISFMASALMLMSCGVQMGGYSETDGVYYDPNKDTLPEGVIMSGNGNSVGDYYQYDNNSSMDTYNSEYLEDVRSRDWVDNSKYWSGDASDWGNYTGNKIYVNNYYGSYYPSYGFGYYPYGYYGSYMNFSWGWSNSWGWYSPYWGPNYYSPYWGGYYSNWGWNNPYYYYGNNWRRMYPYQRSGANGGFNAQQRNVLSNKVNGAVVPNRSVMQRNTSTRNVQNPSYNGMRNQPMRNTTSNPMNSIRTQQNQIPRNNQPQMRTNSNGGQRSGGSMMRGGTSSGGNTRSGSGTMRSGGFR